MIPIRSKSSAVASVAKALDCQIRLSRANEDGSMSERISRLSDLKNRVDLMDSRGHWGNPYSTQVHINFHISDGIEVSWGMHVGGYFAFWCEDGVDVPCENIRDAIAEVEIMLRSREANLE